MMLIPPAAIGRSQAIRCSLLSAHLYAALSKLSAHICQLQQHSVLQAAQHGFIQSGQLRRGRSDYANIVVEDANDDAQHHIALNKLKLFANLNGRAEIRYQRPLLPLQV